MSTNPILKAIFQGILSIFVWLYKRTGGRVGSRVQGLPVLLLTTTGRKTGKERVTPLGYLEHDGSYVVIGSYAGADVHPAWFHNLKSHARVTIQVGDQQWAAMAEEADPALRAQLWAKLMQHAPSYQFYEKRTARQIPLILLRPIG